MNEKYLSNKLFDYQQNTFLEKIEYLNQGETPSLLLQKKYHLAYLETYLTKIGVKFFLIEDEYINKDYLCNYSKYYSFCFSDYKKKSCRIHFFRYEKEDLEVFRMDLLRHLLADDVSEKGTKNFFDKNYIGYIVINPIPNTFLGFTLLKHYNFFRKKEKRVFWGTRDYKVHLFGLELIVNSLAFHEQDSNVGACATASIWSVFQKAAESYYVNLRSPIEITRDAGVTNYKGQRLLPNDGLLPEAICCAITKNNLETEIRDFENVANIQQYVKRLIYSYSSFGLPIILGLEVPHDGMYYGHAVTVCGHECKSFLSQTVDCGTEINSRADLIEQIYYHDDQWGPFVRATFPQEEDTGDDGVIVKDFLDTTWTEQEGEEEGKFYFIHSLKEEEVEKLQQLDKQILYAKLKFIILPVYPKIRICYDTIEQYVLGLQNFLSNVFQFEDPDTWIYSNWDIRLHYGKDFKSDIRNYQPYSFVTEDQAADFKFQILSLSLPKYIWVATLYFADNRYMSFIFDATGLVNSPLLLCVLFYIPNVKEQFEKKLARINAKNIAEEQYYELYEELINGSSKKDTFFI